MLMGKVSKIIFSLGLLTFLLIGSFGLFHMGMNMGPDGQMSDCPFSTGTSVCTMSPLEHIGAVQSLFNTLPQENSTQTIILIISALVLLTILFTQSYSPPRLSSVRISSYQDYIPRHNYLQEAFSRGILHPKLF